MKYIKSINEYNDDVYSKNLKPYILTDNRLKLVDDQSKLSKYMKNKIVYVNSSIVNKINNISDLSDKSINLFKSLIINKDIANTDIFNDKLEEKGFKLYKVILKNDNIIVEEYTKKLHKRYSDKYKRDGIYYINPKFVDKFIDLMDSYNKRTKLLNDLMNSIYYKSRYINKNNGKK